MYLCVDARSSHAHFMRRYVVGSCMAYGPSASDTLDFAEARRPEEAKEPPRAIEEDRPRSHRALAPKASQDFAILPLLILAGVAVAGSILMWMFRIPPLR